jgi:hypothetical protein
MDNDDLSHPHEDALEDCLDALDEIVARMERFPPTIVALGLRMHLEALLVMLIEHRLASRQQVRSFLQALEEHTLAAL